MNSNSPRIVFLGMTGLYSLIPFRKLIEAGHQPVGLIIPRPDGGAEPRWLDPSSFQGEGTPFMLTSPPQNILQTAALHAIPVLELGSIKHPAALPTLQSLNPTLIVTACFPHLLPPSWLDIPPQGCTNLHPSLLPAYRGSAPLFWQFRAGEKRTGITLHFMDQTPDTGDIIFQAAVPFQDGITTSEAEHLLAEAGARLLLEAISKLDKLPSIPQSEIHASYQPRPTPEDRLISTSWTARRTYNFIRGAADWGPFEILLPDTRLKVLAALDFQSGTGQPSDTSWESENIILIRFSDGVVRISVEHPPSLDKIRS